MRKIIIDNTLDGKRTDKALRVSFPAAPVSAFYKAFRKKDIKVNGVRVKEDHIVSTGDVLEVYISDNILEASVLEANSESDKALSIVFEDSNLIIIDKEQGICVHPDREQEDNTLIDLVQNYLNKKNMNSGVSITPSLCHRLDRNTGGLVVIAKNEPALKTMLKLIKDKEIKKFYLCYVKGRMEKKSDELRAFLLKDETKSRVFVSNNKAKGSLEIITRYTVVKYLPNKDISLLEVELVTGRTHQIRAHLAHTGHPIIGDGKYGTNAVNRPLGAKQQMLWAYKLVFNFKDGGFLNYMKGRSFEVKPRFKFKED